MGILRWFVIGSSQTSIRRWQTRGITETFPNDPVTEFHARWCNGPRLDLRTFAFWKLLVDMKYMSALRKIFQLGAWIDKIPPKKPLFSAKVNSQSYLPAQWNHRKSVSINRILRIIETHFSRQPLEFQKYKTTVSSTKNPVQQRGRRLSVSKYEMFKHVAKTFERLYFATISLKKRAFACLS